MDASLVSLKKNFKCVEELEAEIIKEMRNSHFKSKFCNKIDSFNFFKSMNSSFCNNNKRKEWRFKRNRTTLSVTFNNYFNDSFKDPVVDVVSLILSSENLNSLLRNSHKP